jgi:hypothetical protein
MPDTNEKSSSKELETALKPLLPFPCVFQVVADPLVAFDCSRLQLFDIIIIPQKTSKPFTAITFMDLLRNSDGFSPPFVFLLEQDEMPKRIAGSGSKYIRYSQARNIPLQELSKAIISCVESDPVMARKLARIPTAEVVATAAVSPVTMTDARLLLSIKLPSSLELPVQTLTSHAPEAASRTYTTEAKRSRLDVIRSSTVPSTHPDSRNRPFPQPLPPSSRQQERSPNLPDRHWAAMQHEASQRFQRRFSPPPRHASEHRFREEGSRSATFASLPVSPPTADFHAATSEHHHLGGPQLLHGYTPELEAFLRRDDTAVDPALLDILRAGTPSGMDMDGESMRNVFN